MRGVRTHSVTASSLLIICYVSLLETASVGLRSENPARDAAGSWQRSPPSRMERSVNAVLTTEPAIRDHSPRRSRPPMPTALDAFIWDRRRRSCSFDGRRSADLPPGGEIVRTRNNSTKSNMYGFHETTSWPGRAFPRIVAQITPHFVPPIFTVPQGRIRDGRRRTTTPVSSAHVPTLRKRSGSRHPNDPS